MGDIFYPKPSARRLSHPVILEQLESRVFLHSGPPDVVYPLGTLVPWLTPAITPLAVSPPPVTPTPLPPSPPVTSPPPVSPPPAVSNTDFTQVTWTTKATAPVSKAESLTATSNGRLYVFGGFAGTKGPVTDSEYYDIPTNTWHTVANLPQPITHAGVAQDANSVYFVGGYVGKGDGTGYGQIYGSTKVWRYDFATNTYSALQALPRQLAGGGAELIGRNLHYFGGFNIDRTDTNVHLVLDLDNPSTGWKSAAPLLHNQNHMGHVVFGGEIYAIAGQTGTDAGLTTQTWVEVYDPATDSWTQKAGIPQAVSHISSATFVMGDRIIVLGGESANEHPIRDTWAYTPATNSWAALTLLPAARFSGVATSYNGNLFFTTGGGDTSWEGVPID